MCRAVRDPERIEAEIKENSGWECKETLTYQRFLKNFFTGSGA